jgi:hypothetical protein
MKLHEKCKEYGEICTYLVHMKEGKGKQFQVAPGCYMPLYLLEPYYTQVCAYMEELLNKRLQELETEIALILS